MALKDEIKKRKPFEHPEEEAFLNLFRTTTLLQADFERLFKRCGISEPQYNVLRILRGAGPGGLPSTEIAGRMITRVPDITRLVDRLEVAKLVERCRTPEDRRVVIVKIVAKGLEVLAGLDEPITRLHLRQLGHLTRQELAELNRLLVRAREPRDHRPGLTCDGKEVGASKAKPASNGDP
jgi:DNA-binding MarR family transcriptional regulator